MSSADRLVVPLNSMCSIKCEMPFCSGVSRREPEPTQMPTLTLRTCGIASVITRTPLASVRHFDVPRGIDWRCHLEKEGPFSFHL